GTGGGAEPTGPGGTAPAARPSRRGGGRRVLCRSALAHRRRSERSRRGLPVARPAAGTGPGAARAPRPLGDRRLEPARSAARRARRGRGARARPAAAAGAAERRSRPPGASHCPSDPSHPRPSTHGSRHRAASVIVDIRYKRSHFAKLLGFTDQQLSAADKLPELKALGGGPASYRPRHLSAYRRVLDRHPRREPSRRQLFLNFKGGTGKTSLSVAYAYRLAELGHRVLLIDLDSQGHATQHLGLAAESLERTVFEILVQGVPN